MWDSVSPDRTVYDDVEVAVAGAAEVPEPPRAATVVPETHPSARHRQPLALADEAAGVEPVGGGEGGHGGARALGDVAEGVAPADGVARC